MNDFNKSRLNEAKRGVSALITTSCMHAVDGRGF